MDVLKDCAYLHTSADAIAASYWKKKNPILYHYNQHIKYNINN